MQHLNSIVNFIYVSLRWLFKGLQDRTLAKFRALDDLRRYELNGAKAWYVAMKHSSHYRLATATGYTAVADAVMCYTCPSFQVGF
jgi:hypothetical protein